VRKHAFLELACLWRQTVRGLDIAIVERHWIVAQIDQGHLLPFLFKDTASFRAVTEGQLGKDLFAKLEPKGIRGMAYWDNGFHIMSANRPLHHVADFKGLKMRIQSSKVLDAQMRALGAIPQVMAFSELYQALQSGVVDGTEGTPSNLWTQKIYEVQKRTWVTRKGVHVDRIASAWLIRRFIDPEATFKFVPGKGYTRESGELRFDMFEAEYTHVGEDCTFQTLVRRFGLRDRALRAIGEVVHDIDCKDDRFNRPETAGTAAMIRGIVQAYEDDTKRIDRGSALLDDLYEFFSKQRE